MSLSFLLNWPRGQRRPSSALSVLGCQVHVPSEPELGQVLLSGLRCCSWSQLFCLQGNRDLLQHYLKTHVALILFVQLCANVS